MSANPSLSSRVSPPNKAPSQKDTVETLALLVKARKGDNTAKEQLIRFFSTYIEFMVSRYSNKTEIKDDGDLRAYIHIGMLEAFDRFDPTRNTKFIYFAHTWMKKSIFLGEAKFKFIHVPINQQSKYKKFLKRVGSIVDINEYVQEEYIREEEMRQYLLVQQADIRLFTEFSVFNDEANDYEEPKNFLSYKCIENFKESNRQEELLTLQKNIGLILSQFSEKEAYIITHSFGLDGNAKLSIDDIATRLGVTKVNIAFIRKKVIRLMRHSSIENLLFKDYK